MVDKAAQDTLARLKQAANAACEKAGENKEMFGETINWGCLYCISAEKFIDEQGTRGYRVYIVEASPALVQLPIFIREHLSNCGFVGVEVVPEW